MISLNDFDSDRRPEPISNILQQLGFELIEMGDGALCDAFIAVPKKHPISQEASAALESLKKAPPDELPGT